MKKPFEARFARIFEVFGIDSHALLGQGGESWVFALDDERVARINRPGTGRVQVDGRTALLAELEHSSAKVPFAIPAVLDTVVIEGSIITVERRLPGRPLIQLLAGTSGAARADLINAYLEAANQIGDLAIQRPWYGDLLNTDAIRTDSYHEYLAQRAAQSLKAAGPDFKHIDPAQLAGALPEPHKKALVHLDAFPGNMLADGSAITAVLDFGASVIAGDRRLDPLAAAVYLDPAITPSANEADRAVAQEWIAARGLAGYFTAVKLWIAAYWSFATDDINLYRWCRKILIG
jgi:Ser/Thr protein kinase RdoA (MazF antagonist)